MHFSMAPPGPKISAMVGFFRSGESGREYAGSGAGNGAAADGVFSLARLGIEGRVRVEILEKSRESKIAHQRCHRYFRQAWESLIRVGKKKAVSRGTDFTLWNFALART